MLVLALGLQPGIKPSPLYLLHSPAHLNNPSPPIYGRRYLKHVNRYRCNTQLSPQPCRAGGWEQAPSLSRAAY